MFDIKCVMFLCLSLLILTANAGVVSFIDPCHWNDDDCILKSSIKAISHVVAGIPSIGVPSMDPLVLEDDINGDNGDLKMKFKNMHVEGLSKCNLRKVNRPEKLKAFLEADCPITATGQYIINGSLFFVPVHGNGDFEITTNKIKLIVTITLKEVEKNGKKYYKFGSFDYKYEPLEIVNFNFDNLYNGDKAKAESIIKILKESWKEIMVEIAKPVIEELIKRVVHSVGNLFINVPNDELELA